MEPISLQAILSKATTTVDGGWNITFSVGEYNQAQVLELCNYKNELLQISIVPVDSGDTYGRTEDT